MLMKLPHNGVIPAKAGIHIFALLYLLLCSQYAHALSFIQITTSPWYDPSTEEGDIDCGTQVFPFPVDWDDDGDYDILCGQTTGTLNLYLNAGSDTFTETENWLAIDVGSLASPFVIDWDKDGDLDIVMGAGTAIDFYNNDGDGTSFTVTTDLITSVGRPQPSVIDWDDDGDYDIIVGLSDGTLNFYENDDMDDATFDGTTSFTETTGWPSDPSGVDVGGDASPTAADIDEDDDIDVLIGDFIANEFNFLANDGDDTFTLDTTFSNIDTDNLSTYVTPEFIDWDGDGHLDFIAGMGAGYLTLYLNDFDEDGLVGDDDCDNDDANVGGATTFYQDSDGDGYGDADSTTSACSAPSGYVSNSTDCDDDSSSNSPDGTEVCDDADNDCDGSIDENDASDVSTWYIDADGDGFGDENTSTQACDQPTSYVSNSTDCDDTDASLSSDCPSTSTSSSSSGGCQLGKSNSNPLFVLSAFSIFFLLVYVRRKAQ